MPTLRRLLPALTSLLLFVGGLLPGLAAQDLPSKEDIRAQIEAVQKGPAASTQKAEAIRFYERALADLQAAETLIGQRADFLREVKAVSGREKALSLEIVAGSQTPRVEASEGASVETLRRRSKDAEAARRDLEKLIGSYDSRRNEYGDRLKQIAKRRSELKSLIEGLKTGGAVVKGTQGIVEKASGLAARCELEKLGREDERLVAEREALESRMALLPKELAASRLRLESAKAAEVAWQALERQALEEQSRASAEKAKVLSRQGIVQKFSDLKEIARQNEEWAKERGERLIPEKDELQKEKRRVQSKSNMLRRRFGALRRMIGEVGLNNSTVEMIRKETDTLPVVRQLALRKSGVQTRIAEVFLQSYTVERVIEGDRKKREQALIDAHKREVKGLDALMLPIVAHSLIEQQEANAIQISDTLNETLTDLWRLDNELSALIKTTSEFGQYLQERILWVPSIPRDRLFDFHGLGEAAAWGLAPNQWGEALSVAWVVLMDDLGSHVLPFLLFLAIVLLTPHLRRRLLAVGAKVSKPREDRYLLTWHALFLTILLGLPLPLLAWGLESVLRSGAEKDSFSAALGSAFASLGTFLLMLSIMVQAFRPGGLCEVHFKWPTQGVEDFHRSLRRFYWLVLPLFLLADLLNNSGREDWTDGLGRIVFILAAGLYSLFLFRSFRPSGSLLRSFLERDRERWYSKNSRAWYVIVSGAPILFILLALMGYLLTARRLAHSYHASLWAFALVLAGFSLAQRWVRLSVKKAAIRAADERQARLAASEEHGEEIEFEESEVEQLDIEAVRTKTSQLFRAIAIVAFLMASLSIWADVLPALKMFERVQLMPRLAILDGAGESHQLVGQDFSMRNNKSESRTEREETRGKSSVIPSAAGLPKPSGKASTVVREGQRRLTLMQLLLFLVSAAFTVLGVRNLPTLVEILLLRRMRLDPGARVAFRTLTQYLVLGIGIISMAGALGIHWDDLQWLVAALTFGLAFGLQEIFANFISGLILLFERPIRVGDIVTIGQTSGTVTKVRLRATLIRDFDKKELLVPNKEFITQRLVNWTLSDTVVRIKIPIAVTMDADVPQVRSILEEVAAKAEDALEDPPPRVLCTGIDEGVIRFEVWLFTNERTNRPGLKDKMFSLIRSRFEEEGIEIAKPQRELFIHKNSDQVR